MVVSAAVAAQTTYRCPHAHVSANDTVTPGRIVSVTLLRSITLGGGVWGVSVEASVRIGTMSTAATATTQQRYASSMKPPLLPVP